METSLKKGRGYWKIATEMNSNQGKFDQGYYQLIPIMAVPN